MMVSYLSIEQEGLAVVVVGYARKVAEDAVGEAGDGGVEEGGRGVVDGGEGEELVQE